MQRLYLFVINACMCAWTIELWNNFSGRHLTFILKNFSGKTIRGNTNMSFVGACKADGSWQLGDNRYITWPRALSAVCTHDASDTSYNTESAMFYLVTALSQEVIKFCCHYWHFSWALFVHILYYLVTVMYWLVSVSRTLQLFLVCLYTAGYRSSSRSCSSNKQ